MKKQSLTVTVILFVIWFGGLAGISNMSWANPIGDGYYMGTNVGWFASGGQSCRVVCSKMKRGLAENEVFVVPKLGNRLSYVCKAKTIDRKLKAKGEVYGNNFLNAKLQNYCLVSLPNGTVQVKKNFLCLCVVK